MPRRQVVVVVAALLSVGAASLHAAPIDSTLFTNYIIYAGMQQAVQWSVCGHTQMTGGCYASGSLGTFGNVGSIIEGSPSYNLTKGTATRYIYVVDGAYGTGGNQVALRVYKKIDTITSSDDTVTVTLFKTVILSALVGGKTAVVSMAANPKFVFIGTNLGSQVQYVRKSNLALYENGIGDGINITAITANRSGYVTVTSGNSQGIGDFLVFNPDGGTDEDGGGEEFFANTVQGFKPPVFE